MKTYKNLYQEIYNIKNLILACKKARKGKTKMPYVKEFEKNLAYNSKILHKELKNQTYKPFPLETFILQDPKTRKISKSDFRDRVVHHALIKVIEPIFDKSFIYDSCANRKGKGTLFAVKRLEIFKRKVTNNLKSEAFCLKADIKHYFHGIDYQILIRIIKRKITDKKVIWLIKQILNNSGEDELHSESQKGLPLGNLTSQFFANVYLNELDYFIKHKLKIKYYIRYVDDFIILHSSKSQLQLWKQAINSFLKRKLKIELHSQKSRIISLSRGIDFVGFRNFYYHKLLRKRNIKNIEHKIRLFRERKINLDKLFDIYQGWQAHAKWADTYKLRTRILGKVNFNQCNYP